VSHRQQAGDISKGYLLVWDHASAEWKSPVSTPLDTKPTYQEQMIDFLTAEEIKRRKEKEKFRQKANNQNGQPQDGSKTSIGR